MTATRVLTAVVLVPVVVGIVLFAPTWAVALCVAGVTLAALREFFDLSSKAGLPGYPGWTFFVVLLLLLSQGFNAAAGSLLTRESPKLVQSVFLFSVYLFAPGGVFIFLVFALGLAAVALGSRRPIPEALPGVASSATAFLFIAWPLSFLVGLHNHDPKLVLLTLVMVWVGDSVAYFVGRIIGRHKLAPVISPNKTWEGAGGNALGSVLAGLAFPWWQLQINVWSLVVLAILVSVVGQVGDLLESAWKRSAGVKDSGALLPGHGGLLDRVDALILAAPAVWWYFQLLVWR